MKIFLTVWVAMMILIASLFFSPPAVAGRYVCLDEKGNEIACVREETDQTPPQTSSPVTIPKPAGNPDKESAGKQYPPKK
jgi:hypothetical protein